MKISLTIKFSIAIFALLLFAFWLWQKSEPSTPVYSAQKLPDTVINEVTAVHMDNDGVPQFEVKTPQTKHYTEDSSTEFTTPTITLYDPPREPIVISAKLGRAFNNFKVIKLYDDVLLHQAAGPNNLENHAKTNEITLYPNDKTATSEQHVEWWQANYRLTGLGLEADLESGWIQLLENVEAQHTPNPKEATVYISSEAAKFQRHTGISIFSGNVNANQGETTLEAEELTLYSSSENSLEKAIATGTPARYYAPASEAEPEMYATANTMTFSQESNTITLVNDAFVERDKNIILADEIIYNIDSKDIESKSKENTSTTLFINSDKS